MNIVADTDDKLEVDVNGIFKEEIEIVKVCDNYECSDILQRIWTKGLNHVYKRDTESFETVAQFVLQHTESILFGFDWTSIPPQEVQQIQEHVTQWRQALTNSFLRDKCQHILDHIHSPHSHPILNKLKREKLTKDWLEDAIQYLIMERGSTIVHRLKVYSSFPDYSMIIQYAKNCWNVISNLSFDHPLSKAISVDEFYSILAYHLTSMYSTGDVNYIFQLIINLDITETLKLIEKFPKITGELESNSEVVLDLLYRYHFNEFLRSTDSNTSIDEHLMILTNSYCQQYKHKSANEFGDLILNIASTGIACQTKKLFIVLQVIQNECTAIHLNFKLRLAYLGLTYDFNQLELKKADVDCDMYDIIAAEAELSEFFVFLSDVLSKFPEIYRECILTAFTLNPTQQLYEKIKSIASCQGLDVLNGMPKGSIPAITNTGYLDTFNYNPFEAPNCIMDTNEIDIDVREDLSRAITHPRLKFLSWGMPYDELCAICVKLMSGQKEDFIKNVVASANETLEYVDIDFSRFQDLPEKEGDDGIERGYHIFLDDDDTSEEDDDKTMTSPEAAELIKQEEIKLKKKKMVLKRKRTICKKLMKNGVPMKKILMKPPPRKIPRAPNCTRIDWKHIEALKAYFKEHSHLIKATQMFNDAQTLIDKLNEMSANKEGLCPEQKSTNTAMDCLSGDLNLNIIPIDPHVGVVVNNSSMTEHENFPNTSLVLPNSIDQDTNIPTTSNITAANLPTPSTSMTLQNPCDEVAVITRQLLQLLDDVDAELRLHYRRQKNYLASIKRKMIKSGYVTVDKVNTDTKSNNVSSQPDESIKTELPTASVSSNIQTEENVNTVDVKVEDIKKEIYENPSSGPSQTFSMYPEPFTTIMATPTPLMNYTSIAETPAYQPFIEDSKDFVNNIINPIMPYPPIDDKPQSIPNLEQVRNHYDEIINMVATACVDETCDNLVVKQKTAKKRRKQLSTDAKANESTIPQPQPAADNNGTLIALRETNTNSESNGTGQQNIPDGPSMFAKPKVKKNRKKSGEESTDIANHLIKSESKLADGEIEINKIKKPRKPRGKNKPKKLISELGQSTPEASKETNDVKINEADRSQLTFSTTETKKVKIQRTPKPKIPKSDYSDGVPFTPNCKLSDLPDDILTDRGNSYMDSIERAIQKVMAGVDYGDIQPQRSSNTEEMTMMEIDGVLENILNMNNGELLVNREDNKTTAVNHIRNDTTIEQDYTENFDLALTNDNLYSNGNEPTESSSPVEDDKNKVTILSELLADEPQYFSTDPSIGEDNGNLDSSNLMNTSTESTETYSNEFNGFAELISPKSITVESQTDSAFIPSENYASYTDISYNTKTCSRLSTDIEDAFVNLESAIDMNNGQSTSNSFEKSTEQNLPQLQHLPQSEINAQGTPIVDLINKSHNQKVKNEQLDVQQPIIRSIYENVKDEQNSICQLSITSHIHQPQVQQHFGNLPKSNGISDTPKTEKLTSSLRLVRKPNFRQSATSSPKIKTKKLTIRLDRSIVDDFISSPTNKTVRLLRPVVVLKRIDNDEDENSVKRPKSSRIGKRKQNRAIWDGETVSDKHTFKRRRDDTDDAEGSSGFTGGSSGSCYSADSQTSRTSSNGDTVDTPPPKSTNGGASESTGDTYKLMSCSIQLMQLDCWNNSLTEEKIDFRTSSSAGKLNNQKIDNLCNKNVDLSSFVQSSSNCNLMSSVCTNSNKLSYFKPIQTSTKFATLDTVLTHLLTLNKLTSILKPYKKPVPKDQSNIFLPNLLKSVPGVETFEHFLAPAHHRYQTVEIVQLAKQLLPATGDCDENDDQRSTNVLSTESTSKIIPTVETNIDFREGDNVANATLSRATTPTTKTTNIATVAIQQQIVTPTTITPHIQKIGQPTSCSSVSINRTLDASIAIPTTRNNSVAVVFVKNSDGQHQSTDSIAMNNRSESTVIKTNSEQQQQKVVQLCAQLSQNQQNSPQLAKILNKPVSQSSSQQHLLQILNAPPSRNLNNNLFTATATNGNIVSGGNSGSIMTFPSNNGGSGALPNNLYICKTDGKTIQLTPLTNNRLVTTSMSNVKTALNGFYINNNLKTVNQVADEVKIAATTASLETVVQTSKNNQTTLMKSQINTRSIYEENYAKFIQTATNKSSSELPLKTSIGNDNNQICVTTGTVQSNTLPKFNHVFGKTILSSDTVAASQTKTTTSTITLTVSDDDHDPSNTSSVCHDAATQTNTCINKGKTQKRLLQTLVKDNLSGNEKQKQQVTGNHVIYTRQMPVLAATQQLSQSTIVQGINRMIQSSGSNITSATANKKDIKIIHQPMSSIASGMRITMPIGSSSMQQIQTKLIRPVIQLPQTILRTTGQGEHRQQFLITTPGDPTSNVRYENLIVTATSSPAQSTSSNRNVDTSTLEQLREFDMVLEQVKERSTTTLIAAPNSSSSIAVNTQPVNQLMTSGDNQIVQASPDIIYTTSNGQSVIQKVNVAYVQQHNLHNTPLVVVTNYCQPQPTSSIATLTSPNKFRNTTPQISATQATLKLTPKVPAKSIVEKTAGVTSMLPKYTSTITAVTNSISSTAPITTTNVVNNNTTISMSSTSSKPPPKLQEDEQTVQRIYNILAEYAEQLRNSPDLNNKPAPRRRCNIPSNTSTTASSSNASTTSNASSTSKKRKSSQSSSSKRSTHDNELDRTLESEDSSGVSLHDQNISDDTSQHSLSNAIEKSPPVLVTSVPNSCIGMSSGVLTPIAARSTTVSRQLIFADSVMSMGSSVATSTSTSATVNQLRQVLVNDPTSGLCGKLGSDTVLMPRNYVLPMSVIKSGGQQYAIVASSAQASKLLESGQINQVNNDLWTQQRSNVTSQQSAIVLQGFLNKNIARSGTVQSEQVMKQPLKIHKSNVSQTFSNIEVGSTLCRAQGNSGAFILQTIPTTMISSPQSTILTNLVTQTQSHNISAFARVPQQSKQTRQVEVRPDEQQRGIIIIENVKEEEKVVATTTTTTTLVAKKRKFDDEDISSESFIMQNEVKWSSDQYLDQSQVKSVCMMDASEISKVSNARTSPTQNIPLTNTTKTTAINSATIDTSKVTTLLTPISSCSDENLRFLINPYQASPKVKYEQRNKHLRNNFILNTNGSSTGNRILLQQLCHERKQAAIERELRLQKSLSEECEDLGVGEPSTSDLFPEADLLFDTCSPAFDVSSQDTSTPTDPSKQRIFFQTTQSNRSNDCDDKSDDDDKRKLNKISNDSIARGSSTPTFFRNKDDMMMSSDFGIICPYVQDNSSSSGGINDKNFLDSSVEIKKEEEENDDNVNDGADEFNPDLTEEFDKLKNSMDWEGGPKKTYSKSTVRVLKRPQEYALTSITKTISSETQPTLISINSPVPPLHQRRITQYHNKKIIPLNHQLGPLKSSKNDVIIIQRKRRLSLDNSTVEGKSKEKTTTPSITPYIHNHSIGSTSGSISSSFKIINSVETATTIALSSSNTSNSPKIINHQMRRCSNQTFFDDDASSFTVNGSNVKASKQMKKR